jgi:hypothetical protein
MRTLRFVILAIATIAAMVVLAFGVLFYQLPRAAYFWAGDFIARTAEEMSQENPPAECRRPSR